MNDGDTNVTSLMRLISLIFYVYGVKDYGRTRTAYKQFTCLYQPIFADIACSFRIYHSWDLPLCTSCRHTPFIQEASHLLALPTRFFTLPSSQYVLKLYIMTLLLLRPKLPLASKYSGTAIFIINDPYTKDQTM